MGVVQDGLVLWLDARAQRQLIKMGQNDSVWKDLSGNGNDCEVHREIFDYPPVLEGGRNLIRNSDFSIDDLSGWRPIYGVHEIENGVYVKTLTSDDGAARVEYQTQILEPGIYTFSMLAKSEKGFRYDRFDGTEYPKKNIDGNSSFQKSDITFRVVEPQTVTIRMYFTNPKIGDTMEIKWVKLEKGNKVTPWTLAPEDLGLEYPDWIQNFHPGLKDIWYENKLHFIDSDSHIQIPEINLNPDNFTIQVDNKIRVFNGDKVITEDGDEWGRNLLRNSNFQTGDLTGWQGWGTCQREIVEINGRYWVHLTQNDTEQWRGIRQPVNYFEKNTPFTISFIAFKTDLYEGGARVLFHQRGKDGNNPQPTSQIPLTNEPKRYTFSFTSTDLDKDDFLVMIGGEAGKPFDIYITDIKFEKGSTATPWTPAPEDIAEINIIKRNTPFVENNAIHTLRFYNRALTDEEIFQNYQATHFLLEPKTFTSNDYYNYYDLNRVEINTLATKDLAEVLRGDINLEDIDFDRNMKAFPFADVLNKVEGNINILGNKLYKPKGWTQPKLDWGYNQPFSYEDANRLERNLLLLYNYAKGNIDNIPRCGMYTCGEEVI